MTLSCSREGLALTTQRRELALEAPQHGLADAGRRDRREELGHLLAVCLLQVDHLEVVLEGGGALAKAAAF